MLEVLGRGGMGQVYRAFDASTDRVVALKVLKPGLVVTPELLSRFRREVRIADALRHPHIAAVHDAGEIDGRLYYNHAVRAAGC